MWRRWMQRQTESDGRIPRWGSLGVGGLLGVGLSAVFEWTLPAQLAWGVVGAGLILASRQVWREWRARAKQPPAAPDQAAQVEAAIASTPRRATTQPGGH
jgi:hypothetical protein